MKDYSEMSETEKYDKRPDWHSVKKEGYPVGYVSTPFRAYHPDYGEIRVSWYGGCLRSAGVPYPEAYNFTHYCGLNPSSWPKDGIKMPRTDGLVESIKKGHINWDACTSDFADLARELEREVNELKRWKEEALYVESQWNPQEVAKLMDLPLCSDIRANIEPYIRDLQRENNRLREALEKAEDTIVGLSAAANSLQMDVYSIVDDIAHEET